MTRSSSTPPFNPSLSKYLAIVVIFVLVETTAIFEQVMMYTALPTLMKAFALDTAGISWTITVFLLVGTATAPIAGRLGDMYGRRRIMLILLAISAVGSIVSVSTGTFEGILVGRALQGTSGAIFPLLVGIAREAVAPRRVPVLISITTGTATLAGSVAALVSGVILDQASWRELFLFSGALAVVTLVASFGLPRSGVALGRKGRFDILGAVLLAPGACAVLVGVNFLRTDGWTAPVLGLIIGGLALLAFWIYWELRVPNPIFNLRMFRRRALVLGLLATSLIAVGSFAASSLLAPILFQSPANLPIGLGQTPTAYGYFALISGVLGFVLSPLGGRLAGRAGAKVTLTVGIVLTVIGFAGYAVAVHNLPLAVAAMLVTGLGTSFALVGLPTVIVEAVPADNTGEAVGLVYSTSRTLFAAVGTAVVSFILSASVVPGTTAPTLAAWYSVIALVIICSLLALVATLLIRKVAPLGQRGDTVEASAEPAAPSGQVIPTRGAPAGLTE